MVALRTGLATFAFFGAGQLLEFAVQLLDLPALGILVLNVPGIRSQGSYLIGERRYRAKDGAVIDMDVRVNLIHYGGKEAMCVVSNDISIRKRADMQLRASLSEKEVLIKEIHHRVKNNLQIISSLLNLQSPNLQDPITLAQFQDSQNRIRTMALIHESLYRSDDMAQIDLGPYLRDLTSHLLASYQTQRSGVALKVETDDIHLDIDTAIPCGLIVNELVSNALKRAFPNGREGEIKVEMRCNGSGQYLLVVGDDGAGMPGSVDHRTTSSLGLQLVNSLTRQLDGTVEVQSPGTRFAICFPNPVSHKVTRVETSQ